MRIDTKMLARYISKECNDHEKEKIEEYIKSDPDFAKTLNNLEQSLNLQEKPSRPIDVDANWVNLQQQIALENAKSFTRQSTKNINHFRARKLSLQLLRYAAVFIFTVSLTYILVKNFGEISLSNQTALDDNYQTIKVQNGERQNITLADGSIVTVDAGSDFKYFIDYDNERHVFLRGEACFKVAPDNQRPFFVHANHAVVRVVGTRFNVRSWSDNTDVITVAEGQVAVTREDSLEPEETVMLTKDEQSMVPAKGPLTHAANIDAEQYFLWMQNEIHFVDSKVGQVVAQLERWYDYHFIFQDSKLLEESISVHIRDANIEEVIRVISVVTETKVERNGNQIEFVK